MSTATSGSAETFIEGCDDATCSMQTGPTGDHSMAAFTRGLCPRHRSTLGHIARSIRIAWHNCSCPIGIKCQCETGVLK